MNDFQPAGAAAPDPAGSGTDRYSGTDPMTVDDPNFLLERLGRDCSDMQVYRELTENSLQAVEAAIKLGLITTGTIEWDFDGVYFEAERIYKLCITDNGIGMTGDQMVQNINRLTGVGGGKTRGHTGNFGVGAKIAGVTRNHFGMTYLSWTPERAGVMARLWRDPKSGQYGLERLQDELGDTRSFVEITDAVKPSLIEEHGTRVTLMGMSREQDTTEAPAEETAKSRWLARYLNSRYFELPENVTVKVREGFKGESPSLRTVTGMKKYLDQNSTSRGAVDLVGARAHWWVLDDRGAGDGSIHNSPINQNSNIIESAGHLGALYDGEIYDSFTRRAASGPLQNFGIIFGGAIRRVVIYVEPLGAGVQANTARTSLLLNGEPLPWHAWAEEFRAKMPQEIKDMMEEVAAGASGGDHTKAIRDRLKSVKDLFRLTRYRPTRSGGLLADTSVPTIGGRSARDGAVRPASGSAQRGTGGSTGNVYARHQAPKGTPAREVDDLPSIDVRWVTQRDGSRLQGDLEDRAARYIRDQNLLLINSDFRGVTDLVDRWQDAYKDRLHGPNAAEIVTEVVHEWHEQALWETVLGALSLEGSPEWTTADLEAALSEEALTSACLARYHIDVAVKRTLGQRIESLSRSN